MQWEKATDIILITSIAVLGVFACLGLYQLISRKSLKKVDRKLTAMFLPLALMALTYFIFDKIFILNTRPDGSGEPSFPSTHTMVVATIFFMTMIALPRYVKQKSLRNILDIIMVILISLTATGRVLSNKHWPTDVICGLVFAMVFSGIYCLLSKKKKSANKSEKSLEKPSEKESKNE